MIIYIKSMISPRCKMMVEHQFRQINVTPLSIEMGKVELANSLGAEEMKTLKTNLLKSGLEIIYDNKSILIESIKNVITEMVHLSGELPKINYSEFISEKLNYDYTYLANQFSVETGMTIQQFIIIHKIEKAKELILFGELNLTQISNKLHYSSVGHLSNQFKKVTGLSPSLYKELKIKRRMP